MYANSGTRMLRWGEYVLLIGGFVLLGWALYAMSSQTVWQHYENYVFDQRLKGEPATMTGYLKYTLGMDKAKDGQQNADADAPAVTDQPPAPRPKAVPKKRVPRGATIGRVEIPRLNISAIVKEGSDDKTLSKAVGHVTKTAMPGEKGNVGIAAHRDTFFRNLRGVKMGDRIKMVTPDATYEYEVESLKIVWPSNIEVLDPTPQPAITLVTCYPFNFVGHAPKRFIVRARQVQAIASSGSSNLRASAAP